MSATLATQADKRSRIMLCSPHAAGHAEAIRRAVLGMLPKNRLQAKRIKLAHDRK
jgi:ribosomal protein L13